MIAGIYARKSNDDAGAVEGQIRQATAFIAKQGWTLGPVFDDNDISGGVFNRPGLNALLDAVKAHRFEVLRHITFPLAVPGLVQDLLSEFLAEQQARGAGDGLTVLCVSPSGSIAVAVSVHAGSSW